jgi:hypothetical protein
MRIALMTALAASSLMTTPAFAQNGKAYGHDPKVCLVTFVSEAAAASQADAGVAKAQYLPLSIAMKLEARSDSISDIYTYGDDGYTGAGVDWHYAGDSTEETCAYLDGINADEEDDD